MDLRKRERKGEKVTYERFSGLEKVDKVKPAVDC